MVASETSGSSGNASRSFQLGHAFGIRVLHRVVLRRGQIPVRVHVAINQLAARHGRADLQKAFQALALAGLSAQRQHAVHVGFPQRRVVGKRRKRGAVDQNFRLAELGLRRIAQVKSHDLRLSDAVQHRLR